MLNGFKGLHEHNIIHRDIKLENFMFHNNEVKVIDLGFSKKLEGKSNVTYTCLGNIVNMAPEVYG
jgi:serine/threonine protein kinase